MTMNEDQMEKSIDLATEGFDAVKNKMLEAEVEEDMLISVHALDLMFSAAIIRKDIGFFQTVKKEVGGVIRHFYKNDKKRLVGRLEAMEDIAYLLAGNIPNKKKVDFVKSGRLRDKIALILHRKASLYMSELQKELTKEIGYGVSMSSLSQIIKRMVDNDIVHTAKEGNKTFCRLTVEGELVAQELSEPLLHVDEFEEILQSIAHHPEADTSDLSIKLGVPDEIIQRVTDVYLSNIPSIDYRRLSEGVAQNLLERSVIHIGPAKYIANNPQSIPHMNLYGCASKSNEATAYSHLMGHNYSKENIPEKSTRDNFLGLYTR
ncbi:MAG: hypothetical protein C4B59_03170 [Candidatus Methanogaster sp.]|uniref:Uncharacterized protein n=1 Tax=Candidatus Methanogaster sp. TaxID=3386292 RepID=A0AC61L584_9EURY|nr:MAG: hypothetical protein C4B59_03170 [ANME-2 cluster archaeon]